MAAASAANAAARARVAGVAGSPLRLEWSGRARQQLREILDYYLEHTSTAASERVLRGIDAKARELVRFPLSGVAVEGLDGTYRRDRAGAFIVLCRVLSEAGVIRMLSVRRGRRRPLRVGEIAEPYEE